MQEVTVTREEMDALDAGIAHWAKTAAEGAGAGKVKTSPLCEYYDRGDCKGRCPIHRTTGQPCYFRDVFRAVFRLDQATRVYAVRDAASAGAYVDFLKEVKWHCHLEKKLTFGELAVGDKFVYLQGGGDTFTKVRKAFTGDFHALADRGVFYPAKADEEVTRCGT